MAKTKSKTATSRSKDKLANAAQKTAQKIIDDLNALKEAGHTIVLEVPFGMSDELCTATHALSAFADLVGTHEDSKIRDMWYLINPHIEAVENVYEQIRSAMRAAADRRQQEGGAQ
jgi:hypothetical protein